MIPRWMARFIGTVPMTQMMEMAQTSLGAFSRVRMRIADATAAVPIWNGSGETGTEIPNSPIATILAPTIIFVFGMKFQIQHGPMIRTTQTSMGVKA